MWVASIGLFMRHVSVVGGLGPCKGMIQIIVTFYVVL
jgi:hypothetical protein